MRAMRRQYADLQRDMEIMRFAQRAMVTHQMILRGPPANLRALYFPEPRTDFTPRIQWVEEATAFEEPETPDRPPSRALTPRQMDDLIAATIIVMLMSIFFASLPYPKIVEEIAFAALLAEVGWRLFERYKRER